MGCASSTQRHEEERRGTAENLSRARDGAPFFGIFLSLPPCRDQPPTPRDDFFLCPGCKVLVPAEFFEHHVSICRASRPTDSDSWALESSAAKLLHHLKLQLALHPREALDHRTAGALVTFGRESPPCRAASAKDGCSGPVPHVCVICLGSFECGEELLRLKCHHHFHEECIATWFHSGHATCPLCRTHCFSLPRALSEEIFEECLREPSVW